ncbi:Xaa-Pro aminopeptidase [Bacteroidia bacterium]|nr:Xaa-Pro aminopeptidase [Bacteroidia bacterium]
MNIAEKLSALRSVMQAENIDACIIPGTDSHLSEYPAACWKSREWISGFTGSAGTVVVTAGKAGLWTDSRYFIQAETQLKGTGIRLFKERIPGTPTVNEWLSGELKKGGVVGLDGAVFAVSDANELKTYLHKHGLVLNTKFTPLNTLWTARPEVPSNHVFLLPEIFSGASPKQKIALALEAIHREGANASILVSLDMIAWLFNIRSNDVDYNPVAVSYAYVSDKETVLFINPRKLSPEVSEYLKSQGIIFAGYEKITGYIGNLKEDTRLLINPSKINFELFEAIPECCPVIETSIHPVDMLKSIKNETEIKGFRNAMKKDGIALVRFWMWMEDALSLGEQVTELDVSEKLREYRSRQDLYFGESFSSIVGYAGHGAIVHYSATEDTNGCIRKEGLLLVDSGAQFFDGTTDITRTFAVGEVTEAMKNDYTAVLKGNIGLSMAKFPKGTKGVQLDILARRALWENGINYLHGTGHGIGHFLNVHEGPHSIRMEYNPVAIAPGMVTSNEPGIYREGEYGIRIENLILAEKAGETAFGEFYQFETLTLCPIDKKPINRALLSEEEIDWLNTYHKKVYDILSPGLDEGEQKWLKEKTDEI